MSKTKNASSTPAQKIKKVDKDAPDSYDVDTDEPVIDAEAETQSKPKPTLKLQYMISEIAEMSGEPEPVVRIIVNLFMDSFVLQLSEGRKLRLDDHGTFLGAPTGGGTMRIKHREYVPSVTEDS